MKGQKLTRNQLWCEAVQHVHLQFDVANLADEKSPLSVGKTFEHLWNLRAELRPMEKRSHGVCIETQGLPGRFCTWGKTIAKHSQQRLKNLVVLSFLMLFFLLDDFVEGKDFFRFHGFLYVSFERKYNRDASYRCVCDFSSRQQVPFRILYLKHPVQQ